VAGYGLTGKRLQSARLRNLYGGLQLRETTAAYGGYGGGFGVYSLVAPASEQASLITCVHVLSPSGLAAAISTERSYGSAICRLPPANAMTDVTQVVLLSVRRELRSEYDELFFLAASHIAFLSRLLAS